MCARAISYYKREKREILTKIPLDDAIVILIKIVNL